MIEVFFWVSIVLLSVSSAIKFIGFHSETRMTTFIKTKFKNHYSKIYDYMAIELFHVNIFSEIGLGDSESFEGN